MKKVYWRPTKVPRIILIVLAVLAVVCIFSIEVFKTRNKQPLYEQKIRASQTMKKGLEVIRRHRTRYIAPIDKGVDPADSGIIGVPASLVTTNIGYLPAKQTTVNPNWAAVLLEMLRRADVKKGDTVAIGLSGSFPAMNLAAIVAAEELGLNLITISSASASTWGANIPEFTWLDMERVLQKAKVISTRSVAASLGGEEDVAMGTTKKARNLLKAAIVRNKVRFIDVDDSVESIDKRMDIFREYAEGKPIVAYINIGGGRASVGPKKGKVRYKPGLNKRPTANALRIDSVTTRFAKTGIPIIHIYRIEDLADVYGLPKCPEVIPGIGEGNVFVKMEYNLYLAGTCLVILLFVLQMFLRMDIGYRIFGSKKITNAPKHPEPMV